MRLARASPVSCRLTRAPNGAFYFQACRTGWYHMSQFEALNYEDFPSTDEIDRG
jgi:hypothetical protein